MGRPSGATGAATAARLLARAEREFARAGFAGASLAAIARGAGVSAPSLLHHFPTKAALYEAVVRRTFEKLGGALTGADPATLARALERFLREEPSLAPLLLRELLDRRGPGRSILM